jgi:hypothetical protein
MRAKPLVFLSYAHEDRAAVRLFYDRLRDAGFEPWMDEINLLPGEDWQHSIRNAIRSSDFVVLFLSAHAVSKRGYVQKEIRTSLDMLAEQPEGRVFLIPVRLDECELPAPLNDLQAVDAFRSGGWDHLIRSLRNAGVPPQIGHDIQSAIDIERARARQRKHVFVAMPFTKEMEDIFYYGIQRAVDANDFECQRIDEESFTGDILTQVKEKIETAAAVIAELSNANPNVYLELGYAWGKDVPTILIIRDAAELKFDVRGQRCLVYENIRVLEESLAKELSRLKQNGTISS